MFHFIDFVTLETQMATKSLDLLRFPREINEPVIRGVSRKFGEWYQKTNKTEDINILTLLAFKIIVILHNTPLATL